MPKEDYLLKYLEKLSRVIAAMLGLREKGFPDDAIRLAEEAYMELLSVDLDTIEIMPPGNFIDIVKKASYNSTHIELLAKMTNETADCYVVKGENQKMREFTEKALLLYLLLNEKDKTYSLEREMKIARLKEQLNK